MAAKLTALQRPSIPHISWEQFQREFRWTQGEHITLLGPTGYGKSTLTRLILPRRNYVVFFATKRRDDLYDKLRRDGYVVQGHFVPEVAARILLKPPVDPDNLSMQRDEFSRTISETYHQGSHTLVWDEAVYLSHFLKLEHKMSFLWQQARSHKISIVAGTQRPAFLPLYAYDQPTHYFFWRMRLDRDVERAARLGGLDIADISRTIRSLEKFDFLYYNKDTDYTVISRAEVH